MTQAEYHLHVEGLLTLALDEIKQIKAERDALVAVAIKFYDEADEGEGWWEVATEKERRTFDTKAEAVAFLRTAAGLDPAG